MPRLKTETKPHILPRPERGLRIIRMAAENVKRIVAFDYTPNPDEPLVQVTGPNGQGKTSVLDCILYALAGIDAIPSQPIRRGQGSGEIVIDFGDFKVRRTFSQTGSPGLEIYSKGGELMTKTPQGFLNSLMEKISFDPLAFTRQNAREQVETLRTKVKLDIDPDALDDANAVDYKERAEINKLVNAKDGELAGYRPVAGLPAEAVDLEALDTALEAAGVHNSRIEAQVALMRQLDRQVSQDEQEIQNLTSEIAGLAEKLERMQANLVQSQKDMAELAAKAAAIKIDTPIDTAELREEMKNARATNRAIEERSRAEIITAQRDRLSKQAKALTDAMEAREKEKRRAIETAEMPIAGLSFEGKEVFYNGFPFSQASGADQLRISMAIAMSGRKQLRVIRIVDGSLLDDKSLELVKEVARENDYQVWIEMVDTTGEVGIVMSEGRIESTPESREAAHGRKAHQ